MKKKEILAAVSGCIVMSLCCVGCSHNTKQAEEYAGKIVDIIEEDQMDELSQMIFGYETSLPEETTESKTDSGILEEIIKRDTIKVKDVSEKEISYEIASPDLKGIFDDSDRINQMGEEEFFQYCKSFIDQAKMKTQIVKLPYSSDGDKIKLNYRNKKFMNAITGGLVDIYEDIYQNMIADYNKAE